jgi:hypothetical protein
MHYLVKGDTGSQLIVTLTRNDTGEAVDLTVPGTGVKLYVRPRGSSTLSFTINGTLFANGEVIFPFTTELISIAPGFYDGEVEYTSADGKIETVYEIIKFQIRDDF